MKPQRAQRNPLGSPKSFFNSPKIEKISVASGVRFLEKRGERWNKNLGELKGNLR